MGRIEPGVKCCGVTVYSHMKNALDKLTRDAIWSKQKPAQRFFQKWAASNPGAYVHLEYAFHPARKWRLDFSWPDLKLAVEIQGFGIGHQAQQSLAKDCEKMRAALELEWVIIPFTTRCLGSHELADSAVQFTNQMLSNRAGCPF